MYEQTLLCAGSTHIIPAQHIILDALGFGYEHIDIVILTSFGLMDRRDHYVRARKITEILDRRFEDKFLEVRMIFCFICLFKQRNTPLEIMKA